MSTVSGKSSTVGITETTDSLISTKESDKIAAKNGIFDYLDQRFLELATQESLFYPKCGLKV